MDSIVWKDNHISNIRYGSKVIFTNKISQVLLYDMTIYVLRDNGALTAYDFLLRRKRKYKNYHSDKILINKGKLFTVGSWGNSVILKGPNFINELHDEDYRDAVIFNDHILIATGNCIIVATYYEQWYDVIFSSMWHSNPRLMIQDIERLHTSRDHVYAFTWNACHVISMDATCQLHLVKVLYPNIFDICLDPITCLYVHKGKGFSATNRFESENIIKPFNKVYSIVKSFYDITFKNG